ncbi:hypothetical protein TNCV_3832211 [Trichonephila clavipes]|nr:hypothetical protein TNCV_3832211 [Trichonephila clavipes]
MSRRQGEVGERSSLINIHGILESSLMLATVNLHDNTCSANAQNVRRSLPTEKRQNLKLELITAARKTSPPPSQKSNCKSFSFSLPHSSTLLSKPRDIRELVFISLIFFSGKEIKFPA